MERKKIMRWPGQPMDGLNAESISKGTAPPFVIHWAGMKKFRLRNMAGSDILLYFEKNYYSGFLLDCCGEFSPMLGTCGLTADNGQRSGSSLATAVGLRRQCRGDCRKAKNRRLVCEESQ